MVNSHLRPWECSKNKMSSGTGGGAWTPPSTQPLLLATDEELDNARVTTVCIKDIAPLMLPQTICQYFANRDAAESLLPHYDTVRDAIHQSAHSDALLL